MSAKKLQQSSLIEATNTTKKSKKSKANFKKKALLLEPSAPKRPNFRKKSLKSNKMEIAKSAPSVKTTVTRIPVQLQEEMATNLYNSFQDARDLEAKRGYAMWGAGIVIPMAFETIGTFAGVHFPDLKLLILSNLAFALTFRYTLGNEFTHPEKETNKEKNSRATELLSNGTMTSERAQATIAKVVTSEASAYALLHKGTVSSAPAQATLAKVIRSHEKAYSLLEHACVKSETAQSILLDLLMPKMTSAHAARLLQVPALSPKAQERLFHRATGTAPKAKHS